MSMSISPEIAFQQTSLWQHGTVLEISALVDKMGMRGTVSRPWSQMRKTGEGTAISILRHQRRSTHLWQAPFLHEITIISGRGYEFPSISFRYLLS